MPWTSRRQREDDLDREIQSHLELEAEERLDTDIPAEEAGYAAQRTFGNTTLVKEEVREMWGWSWLEAFVQDIRYGVRLLRRSPAFALFTVATLLLSRSEARQREIATRLALGAGRRRIVRRLLTESILLAGLGGALGLLIATWGGRTLLRIATSTTERLPVDLTPDPRVIAFTMGLSALTCLVFGLIPALRSTSSRRIAMARAVGVSRRRRLVDRALVASQVALSLALLVAAGLFLRSLVNLWAQDTGYARSSVLMFSVDAKLAGRRGPDVPNTYQTLLDELRTIPGAQSVSISSVRPVSDGYYFINVVTGVGDRAFPDDQM